MNDRHEPDAGTLDPELLAELDAGALDPEHAARLRELAERDPAATAVLAALTATRAEVAATPAPRPPPELVRRWRAAIDQLPPLVPVPPVAVPAAADPPASARRATPAPARRATRAPRGWRRPVWLGAAAAASIAAAVLVGLPGSPGAPAPPGPNVPLALGSGQLAGATGAGLTGRELGALGDPSTLAGCLTRTGARASTALGGRPVLLDGRPGVLLALPGDRPGRVRLLVVTPDCGPDRGGVLAETVTPAR